MFTYVQNLVMEDEIAERLRIKARKEALKVTSKRNEWLRSEEVKQLARVMDMPITAVRVHRQPRTVLQPPPAGKERRRITVMLLEKRGDAVVSQEESKEVEDHPRRKTGLRRKPTSKWRT